MKLTDSGKSTDKFSDDLHAIKQETLRLAEESLDLQARSMRDNLLFFNLPESNSFEERRDEKCDEKFLSFCKDILKMENTDSIKIDRAHRPGRYTANKTRPIVAKFNFYRDKQNVKQKASAELKNSDFRVADQYPREIKERRKVLYPVMQRVRERGRRVTMTYDRLYIDGRLVTADDVKSRGVEGVL